MNIKLISPRMSLRPMDSEYKRLLSPSLALLTLAALTPNEHSICIEDENSGPLTLADNPDVVGITVNVDTSNRAYEIAGHYRDRGIPVILGGIHPSANPEEALLYADSVCIGDAEELWGRILSDAQAGQLERMYRNSAPVDLKGTPIPSWSAIERSNYLYTNIVYTSKGCPFKCEFCYNSCDYMKVPYRNRPLESVIDEVKTLDTKHVMFIDDNFIGNPQWTRDFLRAIKPLGLRWNAAVSANIGTHLELLDEMKESGCKSLFIGFETINEESIRSVGKYQNRVEHYENIIREIHQRGIMINASLVFGFDHDRASVFRETLDWLVKNKIETVTSHILTPYPGTALYKQFLSAGRIIDFDRAHYNTAHVVFNPRHMTPAELYDGYTWLYKEFYSFHNIIRRMPEDAAQTIPYLLFNLAYRKFGNLTSKFSRITSMRTVGNIASRLSYGI